MNIDCYADGNVRISIDEWEEFREKTFARNYQFFGKPLPHLPSFPTIVTVFGKRLIVKEKEVVLFERCDYCNGTNIEKGLYGYFVCSSCGAIV